MYDIQAGKKVHLGSFYTAYAAAVTAALSTTKGFQDQRDATRISGSLTNKQVIQGYFYTAYAAAVTAALCTTKGKQDERDANLLCGCLTSRRSRSFCTRSMSEKHTLNE